MHADEKQMMQTYLLTSSRHGHQQFFYKPLLSAFIGVHRRFQRFILLLALLTTCLASTATPLKTIRVAYPSAERGFDCAAESDEFTGTLCDNIFDPLLQYDHLARPIALQPRTAVASPEISKDGLTYTFNIKPGIFFTDHPAFNGKKRELVAADYAYSLKRLIDPINKAQWQFLIEGKFLGLDQLAAEAKKSGKFDYDKPVRGIETPDSHTLVLRLKEPDYNLSYILAMPATAAVAREIVERYGNAFAENPVGTGAFILKEWRRSSRVVLARNPNYREEFFTTIANKNPQDIAIAKHLEGKKLPLIDRIEVFVIDEDQTRWLAFLNDEHDYVRPVPQAYANIALPANAPGKIAPNLAKRGITRTPNEIAWLTYTMFNMQDPVIGGYTPERIALRRAISMAYPIADEIQILEKGQVDETHSIIAPGMAGFTDMRANWHEYNPARAKALLDLFGYVDRDGDGYRETPDGKQLTIDQASIAQRLKERQRNELWKRAMDDIGIRMTFNKVEKLPDLRKQAQAGKVQMWTYGWIADYPDGENFLQLFWSKSIGGANYAMYAKPEYDALYEKIKAMPDSPERTAIYDKMVKMLWVDNPWRVNFLRQDTILTHPWVLGYKKHPFAHEPWRYLDIDTTKLPK
jgi:oligopeptide transport system substrate-binding protein